MKEIQEKLREVIKELFGLEVMPEVVVALEGTGADYASNIAMKLAKELHKSPMEVAEEIKNQLDKGGISISVSRPGFLNFILPDEYFLNKVEDFQGDFSENISNMIYNGKKVICEFSDPNPFKVLHVGHLYSSVVGDAISRLFEHNGAKVVRANFGGDVGLHVAKTIYGMKQEQLKDFQIGDVAKCYIVGNRAYEENEDAKKEIVEINKKIYTINKNDEHGTELADLYWKGRELSYEYFKDFYKKIGIEFDKYYPESSVADLGLAKVREQLDRGVYEMSDGAVVFRGDKYGLHTRVFINKEGVPTYEAKDVGLIFTKWDDYKFDKSVVITGNEQADYMKVVLKSIEQYAPELVEKTSHLTHGLVKLPGNVKMSSRLGNGLLAVDVIDMVADELKNEYGSDDFRVVLGAIKYAFLKYKVGGDIIFDPKESVKMTGNSGPYLLYSVVRAKKILSKIQAGPDATTLSGTAVLRARLHGATAASSVAALAAGGGAAAASGHSRKESFASPADIITSLHPNEKNLCKKMAQYGDVLAEATEEMAPYKICNYLYELAQEFSRFYENCPVAGSEFEAERKKLVQGYLNIMEHGLGLLGMEIPEEM